MPLETSEGKRLPMAIEPWKDVVMRDVCLLMLGCQEAWWFSRAFQVRVLTRKKL